METGKDNPAAKGTNYGAARASGPTRETELALPPASPVHANVDAPFRPLAAFVPEEHWRRLERPPAGSLMALADELLAWAWGWVALRRIAARLAVRAGY